jgi:outer membrane protein assembly factor BamD (BamD/ComL family)
MAYFMKGDYVKSVEYWEKRIRNYPVGHPIPHVYYSAVLTMLGKSREAAAVAATSREMHPNFRLSEFRYIKQYKLPENRKRLVDAAIRAGIPE